ncbi:MAG: hypothetical protein ACJ76H_07090, partial [Bacteriovoracaceae bacterium]
YCLVKSADRASGKSYRKYPTTFTDILDPTSTDGLTTLNCTSNDTGTVVSEGTANQETFDPEHELKAPF